MAAHTLDVKAVIVMPVTTPETKVQAVGARATVILHGDTYDEAYSHAIEISKTRKMTFIHPFDDEDVIVGQGLLDMKSSLKFRERLITFLFLLVEVDSALV